MGDVSMNSLKLVSALQNNFSRILACFVLCLGILAMSCAHAVTNGRYGERNAYVLNRPIQYPDFEVIYSGKNTPSHPSVSMGDVYEFTIIPLQGMQLGVFWSAGTGDIGPALFKVNNQCFALEMQRSDTLGRLNDNELVIEVVPEAWCHKSGSAVS